MLRVVSDLADAQDFPRDRIVAVHADLGRAEWPGVRELAERQVAHYGIRFEAVSRKPGKEAPMFGDDANGDLLQQVEYRTMWPDNKNRYCTSDQKRDQCAKVIKRLASQWSATKVLNCMGFRSQESAARAKRVYLQQDPRLSNQTRAVWIWLPIHDWTEDRVWQDIRESGVDNHPAYDAGMPRLSCVFCIFAPRAALQIAGAANPDLLDEYVRIERKIGHTFRKDMSIESIRDDIQAGKAPGQMVGAWNM